MIEWILLLKLCASPIQCAPAHEVKTYETEEACTADLQKAVNLAQRMIIMTQMNARPFVKCVEKQ